jgi:hypothetical protein
MSYQGSCHCGAIAYEVEGKLEQVMECNCSHCSRKGYLLWFVARDQVRLKMPAEKLATYTFNKHVIKHHFCAQCGCAPLGFGKGPGGAEMAAINVRCLENVDLKALQVQPVDGKNL